MNKKNVKAIIASAIAIGTIGTTTAFAEEINLSKEQKTISLERSSERGQVVNTSKGLNIRKSASTSSSILGSIPKNGTFDIISKSGSWYKIKYGKITGYVSGDYVKVISSVNNNNNNNSNSNSTSNSTIGRGQVVNVSKNLNIRKSASTSSSILGKIPANGTFDIISKNGSWYKIKYGNITGYISGSYVKVISNNSGNTTNNNNSNNNNSSNSSSNNNPSNNTNGGANITGKGQVVNVSTTLNIRKTASTSASVLGKIPAKGTFDIISKSGNWYKVKYGSVIGYVSADYVKVISTTTNDSNNNSSDNNANSNTNNSGSSNDSTTVIGKGKVVNVSKNLNIRKSASTSSAVLGGIPAKGTFDILGKSGNWYKIKYNGITGYVSADYVKVIVDTNNNTNDNTSDNANNNTNTGNNDKPSTDTGTNTPGDSDNNISTPDDSEEEDIPDKEDIFDSKFGVVTGLSSGSNLRVRKEPNTTSEVLGYVVLAEKVEIVGKSGSWYKIKYNQSYGYVSDSYITLINYNPDAPQDEIALEKFNIILNKMKTQLGSPYVYGGAGELITKGLIAKLQKQYPNQGYIVADEFYDKEWRAFDCSGLMQWGFKEAGITLGRNTSAQIKNGIEVSLDNLQPGDLLFYKSLTHVGMYIGDGKWIESPKTGLNVRITDVPWNTIGRARRVL